jgi:hypothetical protein
MNLVAVFVAVALAGPSQQDKPSDRAPKKGDSIVVQGCLKGRALESTETGLQESDARFPTSLVYRLSGNKDLLKKMRDEHDGAVVEVTGILKSTLPPADELGSKTFGRTRVRIGIANPNDIGQANPEANRSLPVLEVKSYEGISVKCGS